MKEVCILNSQIVTFNLANIEMLKVGDIRYPNKARVVGLSISTALM